MRRRRSDELMAEAERLRAEAKQAAQIEAKQRRADDDHRARLLGRALMQDMIGDVALRQRYAIKMKGYCKAERDRRVFALDEAKPWFDDFHLRTKPSAVGTKPASASSEGAEGVGSVKADGGADAAPSPMPPVSALGSGAGSSAAPGSSLPGVDPSVHTRAKPAFVVAPLPTPATAAEIARAGASSPVREEAKRSASAAGTSGPTSQASSGAAR
jgi:hypothetical protein